MDQKKLRQVEGQCIQEEAPACQSACPLHVDVRTFVVQISRGRYDDAWKTLARTLPFPGILARICDHPCEAHCLRETLGGAISIGALERACVNQPRPRIRTIPMPKKSHTMAVVGVSLTALVTALELLKKGYGVTLFTSGNRLGGALWEMGQGLLPGSVVQEELATLAALGLKVEDQAIGNAISEFFQAGFSAVFIDLDSPDAARLAQGEKPAKKTFALAQAGVFAGPVPDPGGRDRISPVVQAFQARAAALSMERYVQGVSLTEGREDEGPYPSRLFTRLEGIAPLARILPANEAAGYTPEEAKVEADRCIQCQCLECVKVCPYLAHFNGYPRRYAREIYNNATIVLGNHAANLMVNSCSLCGLCTEVCPENFSMADLCLEARRDLVERNKMPVSAHWFALEDMAFSNSERFMLARHAPGRETSDFVFFPGCQLAGANPEQVIQVYGFLCSNHSRNTGLMLQCCAAPAHWAGDQPKTQAAIALIEQNWQQLGRPEMILACSSCMEMFTQYLPQIKITSLWEIMDQGDLPAGAPAAPVQADPAPGGADPARTPGAVPAMALHDPCTTRHLPRIHAAVRSLAAKLAIPIRELELSRTNTECCGFGGLMENANPGLADKQICQRCSESDLDFMTYCAMCRNQLRKGGKRTVHLLDYLFPGKGLAADPAARPRTGLSESRENRERLRSDLVDRLWHETEKQTHRPPLHMTPEVAAKLEQRRILHQDIRAAIAHGQETGEKMLNIETGHFLVAHRPSMVTFWVEYTVADTGYQIHNSYCHRMLVVRERR